MPEGEKKRLRDRYNEARENMRDNATVKWLKDNRVPIGVGIGSLAFGYLLRGKTVHMAPTFDNTVAPVFNNTPVIAPVMNNAMSNVGHCCKIVQDIDNPKKLWPKVTVLAEELAEKHNASPNAVRVMLSRHFRDELPDVFGGHYRPYGVTTTG